MPWLFYFMDLLLPHIKICIRSGSFKLLMYLGFIAIILSVMVSVFAGRQQETLLVDFAVSTIRIALCFTALLWVQEVFVKSLESKTIVQYLAFPAARSSYIFSVFASIVLVILAAVLVLAAATLLTVVILDGEQQSTPLNLGLAYWLTWVFVWIDISVVVGFCILIATVSKTPYMALVVAFIFYVVTHSVQQMVDLLAIASYIDGREFFQQVLAAIKFVIPDLSAFDVRHWSLYSEAIEWLQVLTKALAAVAYLIVCLTLACWCFSKREIV